MIISLLMTKIFPVNLRREIDRKSLKLRHDTWVKSAKNAQIQKISLLIPCQQGILT